MSDLRVWTSTDFDGHYPVGTSAVVVARDEHEAGELLQAALRERGLTSTDFTLEPLAFDEPRARVLQDGDY